MGEQTVAPASDTRELRVFMRRLLNDIHALDKMIEIIADFDSCSGSSRDIKPSADRESKENAGKSDNVITSLA